MGLHFKWVVQQKPFVLILPSFVASLRKEMHRLMWQRASRDNYTTVKRRKLSLSISLSPLSRSLSLSLSLFLEVSSRNTAPIRLGTAVAPPKTGGATREQLQADKEVVIESFGPCEKNWLSRGSAPMRRSGNRVVQPL